MKAFSKTHPQAFGFAVTFAGVAFFFPDALVIRMAQIDTMTFAVWRGIFAGVVTLIGLALFVPATFRDWRGLFTSPALAIMLLQGIGSLLFLGSFGHTTAANALLILAAAPFLAALIAALTLGEKVSRATWAAIVAVFAGVAIIAGGSLQGGGIFGDVLALGNALTIALYYVVLRAAPNRNLLLPIAFGYFLSSLLALPFAPLTEPTLQQWALMALSGGAILSGGAALLMIGPRYLPAAEVALITMVEIVVGPLLVWWVLGEGPARASLIGGTVILLAIITHAAIRLRSGASKA
jgi:drug/metabolite transporter (DMT)-like permease